MSAHLPIQLGTLGMTDSLILMVMALVVFGPRRLPQIGRQIGRLMYEFRKASNDFKFQMEEELRNAEEADRRKKEEERQRQLSFQTASEQASVSADPPASAKPAESTQPAEANHQAQSTGSPDLKGEEFSPRIMPPATGETVAASGPVRSEEALPEPSGEQAVPDEATGPKTHQTAEALNQHG